MAREVARYELETSLETRVVRDAKARYNVRSIKLKLHYDSGWPDRLFFMPGDPLIVEFKRKGEEPRALQRHRIGQLRSLGYWVEVVDDYDAAMDLIHRAFVRGVAVAERRKLTD